MLSNPCVRQHSTNKCNRLTLRVAGNKPMRFNKKGRLRTAMQANWYERFRIWFTARLYLSSPTISLSVLISSSAQLFVLETAIPGLIKSRWWSSEAQFMRAVHKGIVYLCFLLQKTNTVLGYFFSEPCIRGIWQTSVNGSVSEFLETDTYGSEAERDQDSNACEYVRTLVNLIYHLVVFGLFNDLAICANQQFGPTVCIRMCS